MTSKLLIAAAGSLALGLGACASDGSSGGTPGASASAAPAAGGSATPASTSTSTSPGGGGWTSKLGAIPSLVNVDLRNVLNDLAVKVNLDRANVPITIQIPIQLAANVCGVSVNVLSASTGGKANCTATSAPQELAQVVQQQMAAGGSVGGGAQGGSGAGTGGSAPTSGASTSGASATGATSTGAAQTTNTTTAPAATTPPTP